MNKAVAVFTTVVVVSFTYPAVAQSPQFFPMPQGGVRVQPTNAPVTPFGSAASLNGLRTRSLEDTSLPSPATFTLPAVGSPSQGKSPLGSLEIGGGGLDLRANPSSVFPQIPAEYNAGMKLRYRFDPQE
ncbi:hypothetical protein [Myxacorys almedinensis]|uniref:Uncharacterized protein n=1 Tax=Myxacorys almedinensis A TaxID=2690445 RepID=A0A8J7Z367_9CYAN|nr:hypothetical protein [Myxacorys almedinensis]NDJ19542.1 hypothetical protein [Myxacorys almedinensis A]